MESNINKVKIRNFTIGEDRLTIVAGPCALENYEISLQVATEMKRLCEKYRFNYIFKASFDKANRTSITSYRGPGMEVGLEWLFEISKELDVPVVTDIHEPWQAEKVAPYVDLLQIPAFLCRQTDLLIAASETGLPINIKKAQFMAPEDMAAVVRKCNDSGNNNIILCERGTEFGYHNFTVDFRSLPIMRNLGCPVMFDGTHSVQRPGGNGSTSGGDRSFVLPLIRAAVGIGIDALFMEVHPNPAKALCDGPNMVPLHKMDELLRHVSEIDGLVREKLGFSSLEWAED